MLGNVGNLKIKNSTSQKIPLTKWHASSRNGEEVWNTCNKKEVMSLIYKKIPQIKKNIQEEKLIATQ